MTAANIGTVHDPVNIALPPNVAVPRFQFGYDTGTLTISALGKVVTSLLAAVVEVVLAPPAPVVRLNGEHPTKFGADELTAVHSCILN